MSEQEEDFTPRDYQVALREIAIKQNTIIYLPTGSGKTFIAVLVLKQLQRSEKKYTEGGSISFVVVNTVALVDQHAKCIEKRTNLNVGRYSGDMSLDFWPKTKWYDEFDQHQVFVMTIQILVNLTNQNFLDLNKVNLIVFDECHRGVSDQPMRQLCKSLENLTSPPRILGLTATLLNGNCKPEKVSFEVKKLEVTYHSKVATVDGLATVSGFSTNPKEAVITFRNHITTPIEAQGIKVLESMILILQQIKNPDDMYVLPRSDLKPLGKDEGLKKLNNVIVDIIFHISTLGLYGGLKAVLAHIIQIERLKKHCEVATVHEVLCFVQTYLTHVKLIFDRAMVGFEEEEKIFRFSSEKVLELFKIFDSYQEQSNEELCALIFTKRRFTAKVLCYILKSLSKVSTKYSYIKSDFIVGYNSNPYNNTRENLYTTKKNKEVLYSFDNKEINVLCASNVLEEGVDITTCSLVVKFDHPEEYRSYIQSKGRARHPSSFFSMMIAVDELIKFMGRYKEFQEVENTLESLLVGKNDWRQEPSLADIQNMYKEDELPPYYVDGPNSAKVDMVSSVSLLCQYCNTLPSDKYTTLAPELFFEEKNIMGMKKISVTIMLPIVSPLTEPISGPFMPTKKSAKRAAALYACIKLHKIGELDDHLLPKKCEVANEVVDFLFKHYPETKETMAGTNKNKRLHRKNIPKFLRGPISANKQIWLHIIDLKPAFERQSELNHSAFYDIYCSNLCYGLVTPNAVPTICDFPIYVTMGTLNVNLKVNVASILLSEEDINDIKQFNVLILNDVLRCLRPFVIFDNEEDAETMLLVPVDKKANSIDFTVMREYKTIKEPGQELTSDERISLNVTQESFLGKIVSPWYRDMGGDFFLIIKIDLDKMAKSSFPNTQDNDFKKVNKRPKLFNEGTAVLDRLSNDYLVTEVSLNKSAKTQFPNEEFATYEDYYKEKHNILLLNPGQPLLYVKHLTKKINFIKPIGIKSKRKREKNYDDFEIHLLPELVVKQDFPAALWIQANFLPTLISRFSFLFRLEEFRENMAKDILGTTERPTLEKKSLELDEYLLNYEPHLEKSKPVNVLVSEPREDLVVPSMNNINVNKDYAKKMLEMEYPWKDSEEPKDIERDLDVTVLDIEYYERFLCKVVAECDVILKNKLPKRNREQLALTYCKDYEEKPIAMINKTDLNVGPELCLIYKAMTTAKANDIVNMERLETLGDSFLKLFSSIYIYLRFPRFNEGSATSLKGRLVSNKNLYYLAARKNIGGLMKISDLQISDWLSPGFRVPDLIVNRINNKETSLASLYHISIPVEEQISGKLSEETKNYILEVKSEEDPSEEGLIQDVASFFKSNYIGDKKIADCVEALLGAYFQTCGITGGIRFLEWMNVIPKSENLLDLLQKTPENPILNDKATLADINYHVPYWKTIEEDILGYNFNNRAYLLQALTHSSYTPNRITHSYETLEFIGDAILDFLITCHIFESCGKLDPGQLTDLRSALVNNNTFASLVVRNNLHKHLLLINAKLQGLIDHFSEYIESKKFEIDDEVLILLEEDDAVGLNLAEYIDVPKVLGDMFEALAGAVYLDSGKDLKIVWKVFHRLMWKEIKNFSANVPKNLIRRLYEWMPNPHPVFGPPTDAQQGKVMVPLQFMLHGRKQQVYGFGSNKNMAKKAAAKLALRQLV